MLRVLGPLEVDGVDGPESVGGPIPRRILTALLVRPGAPVSLDVLVDAAWGDDPPRSAERTLISHITRLRESLARAGAGGPVQLERRDSGYRLVVPHQAVDAARLEQLLDAAKGLPPAEAVVALREALALWRSRVPFADLQDTAYPAAEAARLLELHGSAVEGLVAALVGAGDPGRAAAEAEAWLQEDSYRERLWELLVLALYRQGRQADALAAYRRAAHELRDGLGVEPGPRLRELEARILAQDPGLLTGPVPGAAPVLRPCPYKGLARYEAGDSGLFVGRERLVDELVARLVDTSPLVVVGPSGAGKSSLVRAGLVPALAGGALPGSREWSVRVVVPGTRPVECLDAALGEGPDVLVVDQAEEALLADGGAHVGGFGDRVLRAADCGCRVVLVLRSDFYGLLAGHSGLARRCGPATVLVGPPDEPEIRRIVAEPAARVGLRVEPALTDLIVSEVRDRPGVLPVLSTALVRTWEHRDGDALTVASYRASGGVSAALQRAGEDAWAALADDAQRAACRRILLRLAGEENGSWVRRWVRRSDLVAAEDAPAAAAMGVLTERRLVIVRADDVGIAHEALLTGWPRLRMWLEDGRARAATRERLATAAGAWQDADRDPAELYSGTRLQAALDLAAASPEDLGPIEHAFLTASAAEADRQLAEQRARADREARGRRRARLVAAALAVVLVGAVSAGAYAVDRQRQAARSALAADAARVGALARSGGDYGRSLLYAAQAVALDRSPTTESDLFATLLRGDAVVSTLHEADVVAGAAVGSDGSSVFGVDIGGELVRWSVRGGAAQRVLHLGHVGDRIDIAADGDLVVGYWSDGSVPSLAVLDPSGSRLLADLPDVQTRGWALSGDRRYVVLIPDSVNGSPPSVLRVWRLGSPTSTVRDVPVGAMVRSVVPCGPALACALTDSGRVTRIGLPDAKVVASLRVPPDTLDAIAGSADGRQLAIARPDGVVRLVDARSGKVLRELSGVFRDPHPLSISPDGRRVVAADLDALLVWRTDRDGLPERHDVFGGAIQFATWSLDGTTVAAGGGGVVLLDATGRRRVGSVASDAGEADTSTLWPTSSTVVMGEFSGRVAFVDPVRGGIDVRTAPARAGRRSSGLGIETARSGPDGRLLVTTNAAGDTAVWDVAERRLLGTVDLPSSDDVHWPETWVSPDGREAATIRTPDGPIVFDLVTRRVLRKLPPLPAPQADSSEEAVTVAGWASDGRSIIVTRRLSNAQSDLLLIDAVTGAVRLHAKAGDVEVEEAAMNSSRGFIALAMIDGTLRILDVGTGLPLATLHPADQGLNNVSISPDGRYIAASGFPPTVSIWDSRTFSRVGIPLPLDVTQGGSRARFGPDGRLWVATGHVLQVFPVDPDQWLALACREAGRTLTKDEYREILPGRPYQPACA